MDSSDSLKIDENLARFLAAYDQSIEGGDEEAVTLHVPMPASYAPLPNERPATPLRNGESNEGSQSEVLPDSQRSAKMRSPFVTPPPGAADNPHRIGRFELRRQLGKGGCGIVFLAYDPKLQRDVALKIPRPEMVLNSDAKSRLKREALAAAEFDHPNLVPVFEYGEIGPLCYVATAFCPGQTLAEWLDKQAFPVPVRQVARLVATVAEAVQHSHDRGVLHRDLKPNNVILQELKLEEPDEPPPGNVQLRTDYFVPRLVDFGLAKLLERGGPSETGTRQILGTPKYMAPEQAQGRREDIGPPADVYALGVILYELLTGRAPYDGASDVEVLRQAVEGKPIPPRQLRPDAPRDLEAICLKAMARGTTERYRTAIDLADDLRRFLDGLPTIARPLAWPGRALRWLQRNDQLVAIAVLAVIVLFVTGLGSWNWYESRKDRKERANEQANRNRAEQEREYSRQMRDAFLAWRSGNTPSAQVALENARRAALMLMEAPEFTHEYLTRLARTPHLMIVCSAGPVTALAVSPDARLLASGHSDGTVCVWDRTTGKQLGTLKAHEADVKQVAFALSGKMLLTSGKLPGSSSGLLGWTVSPDGAVSPEGGEPRTFLPASCFAVSSDGMTLYAGGADGLIWKQSLQEPKPRIQFSNRPGQSAFTALAVSRDGQRVFSADATGTLMCWTAALDTTTAHEYKFDSPISALAVSESGLPVIGFERGHALVVDRAHYPRIVSGGDRVLWIGVSADGTYAMNSDSGRVVISGTHELATGDSGPILAGVLSPDGHTLFTGSQDGVIQSWSIPPELRDRAVRPVGHISAVGISRDAKRIAVANQSHLILHDGTGERNLLLPGTRPFSALRFVSDETITGVVLSRSAVTVQEFTGNTFSRPLRVTVPDNRSATVAALTLDASRIAVGDDAGRVTIWAGKNTTPTGTINTSTQRPVSKLVFTDDGQFLATHTATGVGVWSIPSREPVVNIETDSQAVFRFIGSDRIATAGRDGVVRVWTFNNREDFTLYGHVGRVTGLGISPDGRTLVSGGANGEVKFWDLRTGQELLSLRRHSTPVTVIEFAANGKLLVTGGEGQLAVWDARSE